jgi:hypothetical protein
MRSAVGRRGRTSPIVILLLSGILVAFVVLIVVLLTQRDGGGGDKEDRGKTEPRPTSVVAEGQKVERTELPKPPKSPQPISDPNRIKETLKQGKTYAVVLKAGLDARVEDKAWGFKEVVSLAYAAEMAIDRTIESNDGKRIVELRHFVTSRNTKILCNVEQVTIDLGGPGNLLLGALDYLVPGTTETLAVATPIAEAILGTGAQQTAQSEATKAVAHVDTLSGKKVRITYADGVGVEAIEPVGCTLSAEERDFVFNNALLSDCYILPDVKLRPGATWAVDGSQLGGFLDPSLRGATTGEVIIARAEDDLEGGKQYATLQVQSGTVSVDRSDAATRRVGSFTPRGTLRFCITDGYVDRSTLVGRFDIEEVSQDHILFETRFESRPTLKVEYACTLR